MQKKRLLPVAVLGLALVATACAPNANDNDLGINDRDNFNNVTYRGPGVADRGPGVTGYRGPGVLNNRGDNFRGLGNDNYDNRYGMNAYDNTLNGARDLNPNLNVGNPYRTSLNDEADRIADIAAGVNGVDSATALIVGGNAYVGLDIAERLDADRADDIQAQVVRAVQRAMPQYDVRVTSDKGFFQRIGTINRGVRNGDNFDRYNRDVDYLDRNMRTNR